MAGDEFTRVMVGQRRRLPATVWNAMLETVDYVRGLRVSGGAMAGGGGGQNCILPVKNQSGSDRARFEVLYIDSPLFSPSDNLDEFQNRPALVGIQRTLITQPRENCCVLTEPIAAGEIGLAVVSGIVPVKVNVSSGSEWFDRAILSNSSLQHLDLAPYGPGHVLWKESGTGEKWAIVRLGSPSGKTVYWGKLDAQLNPGDHASVSIWWGAGDTGYNVSAYDWLLKANTNLPSGTKVKVEYFPQDDAWFVTAAECS